MIRIGITPDTAAASAKDAGLGGFRYESPAGYAQAVRRAGAMPLLLPYQVECIEQYLEVCDGLVLAGGDDPNTEPFGDPVHPEARRVHPQRQVFETALLAALDRTAHPVLGICLGMQWMALHHGGRLDQFLPETQPESVAAVHAEGDHEVVLCAGDHRWLPPRGRVRSHHRQAVREAGRLRVCARSDPSSGGLIEAIDLPGDRFYLGIQWHPERTTDSKLGEGLFKALVEAAGDFRQSTSRAPGQRKS